MKFFIYVWSYVTLYPVLTPIVLLPLFWLARMTILAYSRQVNAAFIMFATVASIIFATYFNYVDGPEAYSDFLGRRGVETDATVTSVAPYNSSIATSKATAIEVLFRDENNRTYKLTYSTDQRRLLPSLGELEPVPEIGEQLRIRYFPGVESGFIVLTAPEKSVYGARLRCAVRKSQLATSETRFKFETPPLATTRKAYQEAIQAALEFNCLTPTDRDLYRGLLKTL